MTTAIVDKIEKHPDEILPVPIDFTIRTENITLSQNPTVTVTVDSNYFDNSDADEVTALTVNNDNNTFETNSDGEDIATITLEGGTIGRRYLVRTQLEDSGFVFVVSREVLVVEII